jgi:hypothetical protein
VDCTAPTSPQESSLAPLTLNWYEAGGGGACVGFGVDGAGLGAVECVEGTTAGAVLGGGAAVVCAVVGCGLGRGDDEAAGRWVVLVAVGDGGAVVA